MKQADIKQFRQLAMCHLVRLTQPDNKLLLEAYRTQQLHLQEFRCELDSLYGPFTVTIHKHYVTDIVGQLNLRFDNANVAGRVTDWNPRGEVALRYLSEKNGETAFRVFLSWIRTNKVGRKLPNGVPECLQV